MLVFGLQWIDGLGRVTHMEITDTTDLGTFAWGVSIASFDGIASAMNGALRIMEDAAATEAALDLARTLMVAANETLVRRTESARQPIVALLMDGEYRVDYLRNFQPVR